MQNMPEKLLSFLRETSKDAKTRNELWDYLDGTPHVASKMIDVLVGQSEAEVHSTHASLNHEEI